MTSGSARSLARGAVAAGTTFAAYIVTLFVASAATTNLTARLLIGLLVPTVGLIILLVTSRLKLFRGSVPAGALLGVASVIFLWWVMEFSAGW